jgi:hypothetical protein
MCQLFPAAIRVLDDFLTKSRISIPIIFCCRIFSILGTFSIEMGVVIAGRLSAWVIQIFVPYRLSIKIYSIQNKSLLIVYVS